MKRKLFLACALALVSFMGVSAQWYRTLATGTLGEQITHEVNGTSVTQYRAETALISPGESVNSIRYTVMQTYDYNTIYEPSLGPTFALAELIVLDANGDTINYTVGHNCGHNELTGSADGAGVPALNDGNLGNYFHSVWNGSYSPEDYHYLEFNLEKAVDAFQLVWYTRPNQDHNRPLVIGLTPGGLQFTEADLYKEYNYSQGETVTTAAEIADGGNFTLYVDPIDEYTLDNTTYEANGDTYVSLSGYVVASNPEPGPGTIVQFIPAGDGKFILYQPVAASYYGNPDSWIDGYNGSNGWQRASDIPSRLGLFEVTPTADGQFEITTYATRQWDGTNEEWVDYAEPLKLWVGYEIRGQLKLFPEGEKNLLEAGDYESGKFHLPVDFTFRIDAANVDETVVPALTVAELCEDVMASTLELANEKRDEYAEWVNEETDYEDAAAGLDDAINMATEAVAAAEITNVFEAKDALTDAIRNYVAMKANYYGDILVEALNEECQSNFVEPPYTTNMTGAYTAISQSYIDRISEIASDVQSNYTNYSYSDIESKYDEIESCVTSFYASTLKFTEFPAILGEVGETAPGTLSGNSQIWKNNFTLTSAVDGVRLTFLDNVIGNAGGSGSSGGFPMIALGEIKIYDANGDEVTLTAENFSASATETQEGFESTAARLCDGVITGTGSYYHSPWSFAPSELVWIEISFPETMDNFAVEIYGRDKSTTQGLVSLFPTQMAVSHIGEKYDPLLFTENPYNVYVGEQVTSVDQIAADGLYVIKGLLNTSTSYGLNDEGEPTGVAKFYEGSNTRYHESAAAVREGSVYRIIPNGDGTYKFYSLKEAKYWPSTTDEGSFITPTYSVADAGSLKIVPATSGSFENTFVIYEEHTGLQSKDSIDTDDDDAVDAEMVYNTPYVVYMDWYSGVASRPVIDPQPRGGVSDEILDSKGDSLHFNKGNGEGQWEIYKVTMDNPDFYLLSNMTSVVANLGLLVGTDPGCVESLGSLETPLAEGIQCVEDSNYIAAPTIAAKLAAEIANVDNLEKVPMTEGVYMIQSAYPEFYNRQNVTKSIYATVTADGVASLGWKDSPTGADETFYFSFEKSADAESLENAGTLTSEEAAQCYNIRAIATYDGAAPWYIGESDSQSTTIELAQGFTANYVVKESLGSAFNFANPGNLANFCLHAAGHGSGAGSGSTLVYWVGDPGASQWYLKKVDYETSIEDLIGEGDEVVSVAYYTPAGAAVPAPVKGINIVVTVYANGVVETKKVLVK